MGHCAGLSCPVPYLNASKGPSYYTQKIIFQFQMCYHSHLNNSQKTKTNINFRGQAWVRHSAQCWVKGFILPHKYHALNFKVSGILQLTENVKRNNDIAGYHLDSRRAISNAQRLQMAQKDLHINPNISFVSFKCVIKTS